MQKNIIRNYCRFEFHSANYRIAAPDKKAVSSAIRRLRTHLEEYLNKNPTFRESLNPLPELPQPAPECARRMHEASLHTGVGPMAAVAGTFAQMAVAMAKEADGQKDDAEYIVENGGDIYAELLRPLIIGLWVGRESVFQNLALRIEPEESPIAVCSSSSRMGHSLSMGSCDLVTVISENGSLADACATAVCNRIKSDETLQPAVEWGIKIKGVRGILALRKDKMAAAGQIPDLIRHGDPELNSKVTRHEDSSFSG